MEQREFKRSEEPLRKGDLVSCSLQGEGLSGEERWERYSISGSRNSLCTGVEKKQGFSNLSKEISVPMEQRLT